jgi:hypothetical protein
MRPRSELNSSCMAVSQDSDNHDHHKSQVAVDTMATITQYPLHRIISTAGATDKDGSAAVVPFARVPLMRTVRVPLTFAIWTALEFVRLFPKIEFR